MNFIRDLLSDSDGRWIALDLALRLLFCAFFALAVFSAYCHGR